MDKVFYLNSTISTKSDSSKSKSLQIAGYANTAAKDRTGDIIQPEAWAKGVDNFRKNPVLLFQHKSDQPIGRISKIKVDKRGIFVEATISEAAERQYGTQTLIKDGALKSFSVGFRVKDHKYDRDSDTTVITDLELLEISVVSIPANQDSLFSIRKSFESEEEYKQFMEQFDETPTEGLEDTTLLAGITSKDIKHYHSFSLDEDGNGSTTFTSKGYEDHIHEVIGKEVQEADGHVHDISSLVEVGKEQLEVELKASKEIEETKDDEDDPYKMIPFENQLALETSKVKNGTYVNLEDKRYVVTKIATCESPVFQFKQVDINGKAKEEVISIPATTLEVVNSWDLDSEYDVQLLCKDYSEELTTKSRQEILGQFDSLVTLTEKELFDLKNEDKIKENSNYQTKLNKTINLVSTEISDWTDSNYIAAKQLCEMITKLKALNHAEAEEITLALMLHGHKVNADNITEEKEKMATQKTGDIELPVADKEKSQPEVQVAEEAQAPATVAEPRVAELVEKTGEALKSEAADIAGAKEEVQELMSEIKSYRDQIASLTQSKMVYQHEQRSTKQFSESELADAYILAKSLGFKDDESIFNTKIGRKIKAVTTVDAFLSNFSNVMQRELEQELIVANMFKKVQIDARNFRVPVAAEDTDGDVAQYASGTFTTSPTDATNVPTTNQHGFSAVTFTPHKFMATTHLAKDEEEDTVFPLLSFLREAAARRLARAIDKSLLRGDGSLSGFTASPTNAITVGTGYQSVITGVVSLANAISGLVTTTASATTKPTPTNIASARAKMGKYGLRVGNGDLVYLTSVEGYNELVQTADFRTVDTFGPQATYHTGTLGSIWGIPVMISEFMDTQGTAGNQLGALVYLPGFMIAERRGFTVETEYQPRQQSTAIYLSTRLDMHALTTETSAALSTTWSMASIIEAGA